MAFESMETEFVTSLHGRSRNPSPLTALGTLQGIRAAATEGLRRWITRRYGGGSAGTRSCRVPSLRAPRGGGRKSDGHRHERGKGKASSEFLFRKAVVPGDIYAVDADIFAPCALGVGINDDTIPLLKVDIVTGGANNQLAEPSHEDEFQRTEILLVPDYIGNAGGLINIYGEVHGWASDRSRKKVEDIFETLCKVFELARGEGTMPATAADSLAEQQIRAAHTRHGTAF